jgi:hypothetical protein
MSSSDSVNNGPAEKILPLRIVSTVVSVGVAKPEMFWKELTGSVLFLVPATLVLAVSSLGLVLLLFLLPGVVVVAYKM